MWFSFVFSFILLAFTLTIDATKLDSDLHSEKARSKADKYFIGHIDFKASNGNRSGIENHCHGKIDISKTIRIEINGKHYDVDVENQAGFGAASSVFAASDPSGKRCVAIKAIPYDGELKKAHITLVSKEFLQDETVAKWSKEQTNLKYIVKTYDTKLDDKTKRLYIIMEMGIDNLQSRWLRGKDPMRVKYENLLKGQHLQEAAKMLEAIALDAAHGLTELHPGFIHLDMKSNNVLCVDPHHKHDASGSTPAHKLIDFQGSCKIATNSEKKECPVLREFTYGRYASNAPEALYSCGFDGKKYQKVTTKSDIWAYGVFLYDLVFKSVVWKSDIAAQGKEMSATDSNGQKVIQSIQPAYAGIDNCRSDLPFTVSRRVKNVTDEEVKKALGDDWNRDMIVKIAKGAESSPAELGEEKQQLLNGFVERERRFITNPDQKYDEMKNRSKLTQYLKELTAFKTALEAHAMMYHLQQEQHRENPHVLDKHFTKLLNVIKASLQLDPKKRPTAREIVDYLHPGKHGSDHSLPHLPSAEDRTEEQAAKTVELKTRYEEFFQSVITKLTVLDDAGIPTKIDDETLASLHKELEELKQEMGSLMGEISGVCEKDSHCSEVENKQLEKLAQEERIREEEAAASKASKGDGDKGKSASASSSATPQETAVRGARHGVHVHGETVHKHHPHPHQGDPMDIDAKEVNPESPKKKTRIGHHQPQEGGGGMFS